MASGALSFSEQVSEIPSVEYLEMEDYLFDVSELDNIELDEAETSEVRLSARKMKEEIDQFMNNAIESSASITPPSVSSAPSAVLSKSTVPCMAPNASQPNDITWSLVSETANTGGCASLALHPTAVPTAGPSNEPIAVSTNWIPTNERSDIFFLSFSAEDQQFSEDVYDIIMHMDEPAPQMPQKTGMAREYVYQPTDNRVLCGRGW